MVGIARQKGADARSSVPPGEQRKPANREGAERQTADAAAGYRSVIEQLGAPETGAGGHRREVLVEHRGFWRRAPESRPNLRDRRLQLALADPGMDVRLSTHYHADRTAPLPAELRVTLEKSPSKVRAPKISKTTPRKVAGGRHGCFESKLTRRANQRHFFTIPQSCKRPSLRNNGRVGCDCGSNPHPPLKLHRLAAANDRLRVAEPRARPARVPQGIST